MYNNAVNPVPQPHHRATYFSNISGDEKMLDFSTQSSLDIFRTVKALHPFLPTYISYKNRFFVVNPYSIKILQKDFLCASSGDIVYKNPQDCSLTIICSDKKAVQFSGLKLYKNPRQTKRYIDKSVKLTF